MAGTITFSGLSSGLDTSSWVEALVSVKQSTVTSLQDKLTVQKSIQNVISSIKSFFTSFQGCLQKITDSQFGTTNMDIFAQNLATSSNVNVVTASVTTEAARQSYEVLVEQLATATKAKSGYKTYETTKADLNTTLGALGIKKGAITVGTSAFSVSEKDTIRDLISKFQSIGITASFDEKKAQLTVNTDVDTINDGTTNLKSVFGLANKATEITIPNPGIKNDTKLSDLGIMSNQTLSDGVNNWTFAPDITFEEINSELQSVNPNLSLSVSNGIVTITNSASSPSPLSGTLLESLGMDPSDMTTTISSGNIVLGGGNVTPPSGSTGTPETPYISPYDIVGAAEANLAGKTVGISSAADLQMLSTLVAAGVDTTGVTFVLTNDINMSSVDNFTPIGDNTNKFKGVFDGQGYVIKNLTINNTTNYTGLFGYTEGAEIRNVGLEDVNITSADYTGSLVGYANNSSIENSYATGTVNGANDVGGLVGCAYGSSIENSYATGTVNGADNVGGLVGYNYGTITDSYSTVTVTGTLRTGGLVGGNSGTITCSYAAGNVTLTGSVGGMVLMGQASAGGLVGDNGGTITCSYAAGNVTSTGGSRTCVGGLVGYMFAGTISDSYTVAKATGGSNTGGFVGYKNNSSLVNITFTNVYYDSTNNSSAVGSGSATGITGKSLSELKNKDFLESIGFTSANGWTYSSAISNPLLVSNLQNMKLSEQTALVFGATYEVSDAADLNKLAELVNGGADTTGVTFALTSDIDMSSIVNFTPIGNSSNKFKGIFDGQGHVISNLTIDRGDYTGLFGYTEGGEIRNVGLENVDIRGGSYTGSLVGKASSTAIKNVYASGTVTGTGTGTGGLIGEAAGTSTIENSYYTGEVTGNARTGGLIGTTAISSNVSVTNCYTVCTTSGTNFIGGLIGRSMGTLAITNCYTTGSSSGTSVGGVIGGYYGSSPTITNSYYNSNNNSTGCGSGSITGLTGKAYSELQNKTFLESIGFTYANGWTYSSDVSNPLLTANLQLTGVAEQTSFVKGQTYTISTADDLNKLAELVNSGTDTTGVTFVLTNDIDMSGVENFTPIGSSNTKSFKGVFDGQGHVIKNLTIDKTAYGTGLFGYVSSATIKNLGLEDVDISGGGYTGSLAGYVNGSTIENCYATGKVTGTSMVGGFVGNVYNDTVINNSYAACTTSGTTKVGGLVGQARGSLNITNSYALGATTGSDSYVGGLLGYTTETPTFTNCYYNTDNNSTGIGNGSVDGLTGKTTTELQNRGFLQSIGFSTVNGWGYNSEDGRPVLIASNTFSIPSATTPTAPTPVEPEVITPVTPDISISQAFSSDKVMNISSAEDLNKLALLVNNGVDTTGVTFVLTNDIDMSGVANFTPIGNSSYAFQGTFDGQGFVIKNLTQSGNIEFAGLFGCTGNATIQNVGLENINITSGNSLCNLGGLVGYAFYSTISNCYVTGTLSGSSDCTGGIIGFANNVTITDSHAAVTISGANTAGGLAGYITDSSLIRNCYAIGDVSATCVGGLIGAIGDTGSTVTNSYATGNVTSDNTNANAGGLIGEANGTITNCYSTGTVNVTGVSYAGGFVGRIGSCNITDSYTTGTVNVIDSTYASVGGFVGYASGGSITNVYYNSTNNSSAIGSGTATGITGKSLSELQNQTFLEAIGFTSANGWTYPSAISNPLLVSNPQNIKLSDQTELKAGSTYTISTAAELNKLAEMVFHDVDTTGVTFILTNDIDMSGVANFMPIGDNTNKFKGTFDGQGYVINNLTINNAADLRGLFGYTDSAVIKNLGLENVNITGGGNYTGSLVGMADNTTIEYCYATGTVNGTNYVGGLVGYNQDSIIENCYTTTTVNGTSNNIGGLVGAQDYIGKVINCYATGSVNGTGTIGGLVGSNQAGSQVINSYATGTVHSGSQGCGLIGSQGTGGSNTNSYYNSDNNPPSSDGTGKALSELQNKEFLETLGFTTDNGWVYETANSNPTFMPRGASLLNESNTIGDVMDGAGGTIFVKNGNNVIFSKTYNANETIQSLLDDINGITGGTLELGDDGAFVFTGGGDISFSGGLASALGIGAGADKDLDIGAYVSDDLSLDSGDTITKTVNYAVGNENITYEKQSLSSVANFADESTKVSDLNITAGTFSVFIDGRKCDITVEENDTFSNVFQKIVDKAGAIGVTVQAGFVTTDGDIVANPTSAKNTGVIAIDAGDGHTVFIGASNDKSNFATITNLSATDDDYRVQGEKALYKVNLNSVITQSGLFKTGDVTAGTFRIGDATFTIDNTTTLGDLIKQINYSENSHATAYWDTLSGTLVLNSEFSGNSVINIESGTGTGVSNFTDIMGFTEKVAGKEVLSVDNQTLGENALVRINGTLVTSATNTITSDISRIKGLTLNLKGLSNGEKVTVTVAQDSNSVYNAVSDVVDAYNSLMANLEKELNTDGKLASDTNIKLFKNNLKRNMTKSVSSSSVYKNLMSIGISTGEAQDSVSTDVTSLVIDKDKLMEALSTNPDEVKNLLIGTNDNKGLFVSMENLVTKSISQSGIITITENRLNKNIESYNKKISTQKLALEKYRARLETKFKSMESIISRLQSSYNGLLTAAS